MREAYARSLDVALTHRFVVLMVALATLVLTLILFTTIPKGFFPEEDLGQMRMSIEAAEDTSTEAMLALQTRVVEVIRADPNVQDVTSFTGGGNTGRGFIALKPRGQRKPMPEVVDGLRRATRQIVSVSVFLSPIQNLQLGGRPSKSRYQYTLQSVSSDALGEWVEASTSSACAPIRLSATSPAMPRTAACRPA
ncbi:efflux RND transporter permease subunit [Massilia sp. B-10]|nr:efflux RND transporter permease subunit [Massilia sp. B-10]